MSKYLFIEAHCDDSILACGGTISRLKELGHQVTCITLSHIYEDVDLSHEWIKAMETLNVAAFTKQNFTTRKFNTEYDDILQYLFEVKKQNYDFVFTHSKYCIHADHSTVGEICERVFKHTNLITYQHPWNTREMKQNYFVKTERGHMTQKIIALSRYESQKERNYFDPAYTWAEARRTGLICNAEYAEGFYAVNLVI